ncbi:Emp24/gp25L/p24 family protein [Necator americanus]|uniref:Emp24/gp25L/p24 family protein n=1 Tax=Necator americanus TaxID=51031 RepID=W2TIZ5_NECAM|nr:Emp24/gp25L/p24 family protein [Necator americanus]ETN81569.1 Emp24/gp25L/p24 family protein [Necator americanus]
MMVTSGRKEKCFGVHEDFPLVQQFCSLLNEFEENIGRLSSQLRTPLSDWFPDFDYPGMPTVDYLRIKTPGPGVYKVKFGNEQAWIRSLTVYYRILFENEKGGKADFKELA